MWEDDWWMGVDGFEENVKLWWLSFTVTGRPGHILAERLKLLKGKLKEWSKNQQRQPETTKGGDLKPIGQLGNYPRGKKPNR